MFECKLNLHIIKFLAGPPPLHTLSLGGVVVAFLGSDVWLVDAALSRGVVAHSIVPEAEQEIEEKQEIETLKAPRAMSFTRER